MYLFFFKCINSFLSNPIVVDTCHNARAIFIIKTTRRAARFCVPSSCKTKEKRSRTEGLTTMKPWVSKNTMTTRQAGAFHGTGSGTTYTAEDTPSASLARAAVSTVPAQDVSLSQLTYSFESGQTIAGPGKTSCERSERQRSPLTKRRACKSEGQLRASPPLLAPRRQPAAPTALETEQHGLPCSHRPRTKSQQVPGLVNVGQRGPTHTTETTLWTAGSSSTFPFIASPSGPWRRCGHSAFLYTVGRDLSSTVDSSATTSSSASSGTSTSSASSSDSARVLPSRVVRVSSKAALAPNTRSCAVDCTRRDVATATDLPPGEHNGNLPGVWMGGRLPLMVGAALLSALLVASAVATTVGITNRQSTTAPGGADEHRLRDAVAGLAATKPLLPGLPYTEYPLRHDPGVPADEAVTDAAWKWPSTASEPVDGDATVEQPAVGYGNASASFVTAENPLEQPFRRSAGRPHQLVVVRWPGVPSLELPLGWMPGQRQCRVPHGRPVHGPLHQPALPALRRSTECALRQRAVEVPLLRGRCAFVGGAGREALLQVDAARAGIAPVPDRRQPVPHEDGLRTDVQEAAGAAIMTVARPQGWRQIDITIEWQSFIHPLVYFIGLSVDGLVRGRFTVT
nr:mucin-5AC-like isoform X2 [Dermacentor andersoni]